MSKNKSYNEETINQFKEYFETADEGINPTFQKSTIMLAEKFHKMILEDKDLELTALDKKLDKSFKRRSSKFLNEIKDKNLGNSMKKIGLLSEPNENVLVVRKLPKITIEQYDKIEKEYIYKDNKNIIQNLYEYLNNVNCYFRNPLCLNSVGGINPLSYLIETSFYMNHKKIKEMEEKFNLLGKYINSYREVNGDGNCFYRAIMFRYIEILILTENISAFQQLIFDIIESFKSEEIQKRRIIRNNDVKPELTFQILFLIMNILKQKNIKEAHQLFVKCISTCKKFDYCLILYLRYIIYKYIKQNEDKLYKKSFPLKIGNLLPQQFETEEGKFLFNSFYEDYLLKFFTDAEKIIIYIIPFVIGIQLNVVVYDIVDDEIIQKFLWEEEESDIKSKDVITLLNNKNHYSIVYTDYDNNEYKNYFEFYQSNIKSVVLKKSIAPNKLNYELDDKHSLNDELNQINNNNKSDNCKKRDIHIENNNINIQKNENKIKENNPNKIENIKKNVEKKENNNFKNNDIEKNNNNKNSNNINNINNNNLNEKKEQNKNKGNNFNYMNKAELKKGINMNDGENILDSKPEMKKNILKSEINKIKHNIDNNESTEYEAQNKINEQKKIINNKIENKNSLNKNKNKENKTKSGTSDVIKEKLKGKTTKSSIENNKNILNDNNEENSNKKKIEKKQTHKNKGNISHKSSNVCFNCKNEIKMNEKNPLCINCFRSYLIKEYFDCFQNDKDPIENIYFILKGKSYNLEQIIKLYNESYEKSKLDFQIILQNIKEKKCILCDLKSDIILPCKCCKYCSHINTYFKNCNLQKRFICPNKVNYNREQMFKLAIKLHKMIDWKHDIASIINYFNTRLISHCFLCNDKLENKKFIIKVTDPNKDEDSNKFLLKINHYLCPQCITNKLPKEFKCGICHIKHSY